MGIFQKITNLFANKQKIEKEIATLQKSCKHSEKSVKQVRKNVDSTSPSIRYLCDECLKELGYPNQQDIDSFFREEKTFLNVVAFCEGENKEMKIFSLSPIEISLFKMFSEIIDHEVGNQNQYVSLSMGEGKNGKV